jgi:hypothetical protein
LRHQVLAAVVAHVEDPTDVAAVARASPRLHSVARFAALRLRVAPERFFRETCEGLPALDQGHLRTYVSGLAPCFRGVLLRPRMQLSPLLSVQCDGLATAASDSCRWSACGQGYGSWCSAGCPWSSRTSSCSWTACLGCRSSTWQARRSCRRTPSQRCSASKAPKRVRAQLLSNITPFSAASLWHGYTSIEYTDRQQCSRR